MFQRISNGWSLAMQSFGVLRLDKELLVFPMLSGIAGAFVLASFALPLWLSGAAEQAVNNGDLLHNVVAYVVLFAFYFANYFVIVYFNAALIACAIIRFHGGDPTVSDGLKAANARLPQILAWALVSATVGVVLRLIESWSEKAGQLASAMLGMVWGLATFFVVPVLVVEKVGPIDAVKRSAKILSKAWGESLVGNFSIGFIIFLASLVAVIPAVLGFMTGKTVLIVIGIAVTVLSLILITLVSSAVDAILLGAVYLYASEGTVPEQFDESLLRDAFTRK